MDPIQQSKIDARKARKAETTRRHERAKWRKGGLDYERAIAFYDSRDRAALWAWIDEASEEHAGDCMDSIRVARVDNVGEMRAFHAARSCCGSSEEEIVGVSGQVYVVGCNFGH